MGEQHVSLCRHSGNQGTTGRPARVQDTFLNISLRTRLSRPGEPREGWTSPREGISDATCDSAKDQAERLGEASTIAGFSFLAKQALSPLQSAHGLCALRRVMGAPTRGDDSAAVATLVYKAVNKTAPSKGAARIAISVIRRPSAAALQGRHHRGAHPEPQRRQPIVLAGWWLFQLW